MITVAGSDFVRAVEVPDHLGPDVKPAMVRDWKRRRLITGYPVGRATYYRLDELIEVEYVLRTSTRGRPRHTNQENKPMPSHVIRFDVTDLRDDRIEEIRAWVTSLGVDPCNVRPVGLIDEGDNSYQLHLSQFVRNDAGRIMLDRASDTCVTTPLIIDLGPAQTWPAWLGKTDV